MVEYVVAAPFHTKNREFFYSFEIVDPDGVRVASPAGEILAGSYQQVVTPDDVGGQRTFDDLVIGGYLVANFDDLTVTISEGSSLSASLTLNRRPPLSIIVPAGWDTAVITFQVSQDGVSYYELIDQDGDVVQLEPAAGRMMRVDNPEQWEGFNYMRIRSGTSGSPVTQTADRTLTVTVRDA